MATNALAPDGQVINALAPTDSNPYLSSLMQRAQDEYPFIRSHNPMVVMGQGEGFAETYPINETGAPLPGGGFSRPKTLPIDRVGVEIYQPSKFSHHDLAAEMLHIDPYANEVRGALSKNLTPEQINVLKHNARDYQHSIDLGMSEEDAMRNTIDSGLRGYVMGQWPEQVNMDMKYSDEQKAMLEGLKAYTRTGKR